MPSTHQASLLELAGTLVAEEVVPRVDVVDPQALRTRIALADVTLQQGVIVDDGFASTVLEPALGHRLPARLATTGGLHQNLPRFAALGGPLEVP
jgi:hypothetical protein